MKVAAKARMVPHPRREWWERSWWDMALSLLCFVKNAQLWTSFHVFDVTVECANSAGTFECERRTITPSVTDDLLSVLDLSPAR
jgi:hypothetical protein